MDFNFLICSSHLDAIQWLQTDTTWSPYSYNRPIQWKTLGSPIILELLHLWFLAYIDNRQGEECYSRNVDYCLLGMKRSAGLGFLCLTWRWLMFPRISSSVFLSACAISVRGAFGSLAARSRGSYSLRECWFLTQVGSFVWYFPWVRITVFSFFIWGRYQIISTCKKLKSSFSVAFQKLL